MSASDQEIPKSSGIYRIVNTQNGKFYVGSAVNLHGRWRSHLSDLRREDHADRILQDAWLKYGEDALRFEVLELVADRAVLLTREQYYLDTLEPPYNLSRVAGSPMAGLRHSEDTIRKMKERLREIHRNRHVSDEERQKRRERMAGFHHSPESIEKCREAKREYWRKVRAGEISRDQVRDGATGRFAKSKKEVN